MKIRAAALIVAALALTGCASSTPTAPTTTAPSTPEQTRTEVDWSKYPTEAKRLIDEAEAAGDCTLLQDTFDVAAAAGFTDQMKYIDEALELAGCY